MAERQPKPAKVSKPRGRARRASEPQRVPESAAAGGFDVLVLGASAGGEMAAQEVLRSLPRSFQVPVLVMLHLGPSSSLNEIYARQLPFDVAWARTGLALTPGRVLLAPPRSFVELLPDGTCSVTPCDGGARERPINALLDSVARSFGPRAIVAILSGLLDDGALGARQVHLAGGSVIVQSEETAEYPSMPRAAIQAGAADLVVPLADVGQVIAELVGGARRPRPQSEVEAIRRVFGDKGEVAARAHELDWASTALGPVISWPEHLRVIVRMVLQAAYPMAVWWGPKLAQIYNEAWRALLGATKHPAALGAPAPASLPEMWPRFGIDKVLADGETATGENCPLLNDRYGYPEEIYISFSNSPIRDARGAIVGVLHSAWDTTKNVVAERRVRALAALAGAMAGAPTPREACERGAAALGEATADVPFALLYLLVEGGRRATLAAAVGLEPGSIDAPHMVNLGSESHPWPLGRVVEDPSAELELVLNDLSLRLRGLTPPITTPPGALPPRAARLLPLRATAAVPPVGVLVVGLSPHRPFDAGYRSFLELVTQQINGAIAEARSRQLERERQERLAELDRAKIDFFANVSHEFRTPLTLLLGPLEDLLRDQEQLPAPVRGVLQVAARNARRLSSLVTSLLDFSESESQRQNAQLEPTDLAALTTGIASAFRGAIEAAGLRFRIECAPKLPPVPVDREMWEKIVSNLLSNALKFTFEGEIAVELSPLALHAQLVVSDTGVGIPEREMPNLFKRFHRIPGTRARTVEGSGIGLSIVKELVTRMGGQIRALSRNGTGSSFTIWMPYRTNRVFEGAHAASLPPGAEAGTATQLAREASRWLVDAAEPEGVLEDVLGPAKAAGALADAREKTCIVVVDDNADMREYLRRILSPHWQVELAADGERALSLLRDCKAELLLADVMMPKLDGHALTKRIREDASLRTTPVVLVTARAGEQAAIDGLLAGADDYIAKPFSARELVARVGAQLALSHMRRRAQELNAFLVRFSDAVRAMSDDREVAKTACDMLSEQLRTDHALWNESDDTTRELATGETLVVDDASLDPRLPEPMRAALTAAGVAATVRVPVLVDGVLRASLAVNHRAPRHWTREEIALIEGVAGLCWAEVERARAKGALRESEAKFRSLLEIIDQAYALMEVVRDPAGKIVDYWLVEANPAWERHAGIAVSEVLGRRLSQWPQALPAIALDSVERAIAEAKPLRFERHDPALGRWIDVQIIPRGERFANLLTDVTARKLAEPAARERKAEDVPAEAQRCGTRSGRSGADPG